MSSEPTTFWEHLDELRYCILHALGVTMVMAVVAFCLKEQLFDLVLAPCSDKFVAYRILGVEPFSLHLMNTGLTEQFMTHMRVALYAGLLMASPYVLYQLFSFVSPGLYQNERRAALWVVGSAYAMFLLGTTVNYLLIFPLTVHFLGTYQVSPEVANMLTLQSYIDTFISMSLVIGVAFELPVVCAILGKMGLINGKLMSKYRRHAIVVILIVAAIITPTTDVMTLIWIVKLNK